MQQLSCHSSDVLTILLLTYWIDFYRLVQKFLNVEKYSNSRTNKFINYVSYFLSYFTEYFRLYLEVLRII